MVTQLLARKAGLLVAALTGLLLLAGCSSGSSVALTGASWPGMTSADDTLYVAYSSFVYAVDPATGNLEWRFPAEGNRNQTFFATPAVMDGQVIVADYTDSMFALDQATGEATWPAPFQSESSRFIGGATVDGDMLYAGVVDGTLYALDQDGRIVWSFKAGRDIWGHPAVDETSVYFTSLDRHIYAVDKGTGELEWRWPDEDVVADDGVVGAMISTPLVLNGVLYFSSLNNLLYAFDIETQSVLWTHEFSNWIWSSPQYVSESDVLVGGDLDGRIFALDPLTGGEKWNYQAAGPVVGEVAVDTYGDTPAVFAASGFTTSNETNLVVLNLEDGSLLDSASVQAEFQTRFLFIPTNSSIRPVPLYASPVIAGDIIVVGSHQGNVLLYAYEKDTLRPAWQFDPIAAQ